MLKLFASFLLLGSLATHVSAREVDRREVAEDFAGNVPQEQTVYCSDTKLVTLADGTPYRTCINWRAQNKTRLIRTYAILDGPETDVPANLDIARGCFDLAVASQNDPYRTAFDEDLFLSGAREQFKACARLRNLARRAEYKLEIKNTPVWLGGR